MGNLWFELRNLVIFCFFFHIFFLNLLSCSIFFFSRGSWFGLCLVTHHLLSVFCYQSLYQMRFFFPFLSAACLCFSGIFWFVSSAISLAASNFRISFNYLPGIWFFFFFQFSPFLMIHMLCVISQWFPPAFLKFSPILLISWLFSVMFSPCLRISRLFFPLPSSSNNFTIGLHDFSTRLFLIPLPSSVPFSFLPSFPSFDYPFHIFQSLLLSPFLSVSQGRHWQCRMRDCHSR